MSHSKSPVKPESTEKRFTQLQKVLTSQQFLKKEGISGEVPFFIFAYRPENETAVSKETQHLLARMETSGAQILEINLYDQIVEIIKERGKWDRLLNAEAGMDKEKFKAQLQNLTDVETKLIPKITSMIEQKSSLQILFITGVGLVYPYIRTHNVLNNLQKVAKEYPTLLFFPGRYTHTEGRGSALDLFGELNEDKYYRAFNIEDYLL
jgi:hypothetical protein